MYKILHHSLQVYYVLMKYMKITKQDMHAGAVLCRALSQNGPRERVFVKTRRGGAVRLYACMHTK
jgi:hypothetical protein